MLTIQRTLVGEAERVATVLGEVLRHVRGDQLEHKRRDDAGGVLDALDLVLINFDHFTHQRGAVGHCERPITLSVGKLTY